MGKTIIVSNRLPVKLVKEKNKKTFKPSEGGLATGLGSIYKSGNNLWIGWPGGNIEESEKESVIEKLREENMYPIFLTRKEISEYYEGFSNETLWPNFHYFNQYTIYDNNLWKVYQSVNKKFCDQIIEFAEPDDTIWIHDYQLLILPELLREQLPDISIGFFLHIPFPSYESFRMLPWRKEILKECDFNLYWNQQDANLFQMKTPAGNFNEWRKMGFDRNSLITDPLFIDQQKETYQPSSQSPAWELGIQSIPIGKIGRKGFSQ